MPLNHHKDDPRFSILIPSWNNLAYLELCVESIRKNSFFRHQLIVHANVGDDGTLQWLQAQPDIDYSHSHSNIGICYALNMAAELAVTDYIVYLNDDMYVCPGWDRFLMEAIEKVGHEYFFISGTAIEKSTINPVFIEADYGASLDDFDEHRLLREYQDFQKEDWSGATWPPNVVHKKLWNLVGGYSIEFSPGMYSDPDFSMKLWKAGVRYFMGVAKSRVYHFGSLSVKRVKRNKGYYTFVSKWGITAGTFCRRYLRMGKSFHAVHQHHTVPFLPDVKSIFKQAVAIFKRSAEY